MMINKICKKNRKITQKKWSSKSKENKKKTSKMIKKHFKNTKNSQHTRTRKNTKQPNPPHLSNNKTYRSTGKSKKGTSKKTSSRMMDKMKPQCPRLNRKSNSSLKRYLNQIIIELWLYKIMLEKFKIYRL